MMPASSLPSKTRPYGWRWTAKSGFITACWAVTSLVLAISMRWAAGPQKDIFLAINQWAATHPPEFWASMTLLGHTVILMCCMTPFLLYRSKVLMSFVAAIPAGALSSVILKKSFSAPRPSDLLLPMDFNNIGVYLSGNSFPSGHTITTFAAAAAVCASLGMRPSRMRYALIAVSLVLAILVGVSRVAVGAHWPADVVAGAGLGWLAGLSGVWLCERYTAWWQNSMTQLVLLLALAALIIPAYQQAASTAGSVWVLLVATVCLVSTLVLKARQLSHPITGA